MNFSDILIFILIILILYLIYFYAMKYKLIDNLFSMDLQTINPTPILKKITNKKIIQNNNTLTDNIFDNVFENYIQSKQRKHIFFDINIGDDYLGRIIFELYNDIVPYTCDNFIYMVQNHYKNSIFHRIIDGFMIQGGDYINSNGTGTNSIYGNNFDDENFIKKHDAKYILSMANAGPNTNGCQFFITLNILPNLDNKHVVFGYINDNLSKDIIDKLGKVNIDENDKPIIDCTIIDCGLID